MELWFRFITKNHFFLERGYRRSRALFVEILWGSVLGHLLSLYICHPVILSIIFVLYLKAGILFWTTDLHIFDFIACLSSWKFHTHLKLNIKNGIPGTSLVIQWLRLHVPNAGGLDLSLVGEIDPCMLKLRPSAAE